MRKNLQEARKGKGLTQQAVADHLGITLVYYQKIEAGDRTGDFTIWDDLEDLLGVHQRTLRVIQDKNHDRADNQKGFGKGRRS